MKFLIFLLIILLAMYLCRSKEESDWIVYGTKGCGWTRKQLSHMKAKGIKHTFVDCDKEDCSEMDAYPTLRHAQTGELFVGYKADF